MRRKPVLIANWKMHGTLAFCADYFSTFFEHVDPVKLNHVADVSFAVPYTALARVGELVLNTPIRVLAQNVHCKAHGPYTGDISVSMLQELGVAGSLVGHSERRSYAGETNETTAAKVQALLHAKMQAIVCVGETLAERQSGETEEILRAQLAGTFEHSMHVEGLQIAYEPVWAIGTGMTAAVEEIHKAHGFIRHVLAERYGTAIAARIPILYGGSVRTTTLTDVLSVDNVQGVLVGGASLAPATFAEMIHLVADLFPSHKTAEHQ